MPRKLPLRRARARKRLNEVVEADRHLKDERVEDILHRQIALRTMKPVSIVLTTAGKAGAVLNKCFQWSFMTLRRQSKKKRRPCWRAGPKRVRDSAGSRAPPGRRARG